MSKLRHWVLAHFALEWLSFNWGEIWFSCPSAAQLVFLHARLNVLEDELRRQEAIVSIEEIEKRTIETYRQKFVPMMREFDKVRQDLANLVVAYRQENPPPY